MPRRHTRTWLRTTPWLAPLALALAMGGCGDVNGALEHLSEARRLAADLHVEFVKAAGASDHAVMTDSDASSIAFAGEAERATAAAKRDLDAITPLLRNLNYSNEIELARQFAGQFDRYRELDRRILDLAVQNTNLKAQRLSFGPAQDAVNTLRDALATMAPANSSTKWPLAAHMAATLAAVRDIQTLQAPHIADLDDTVMTRLETEMASSETTARRELAATSPLVSAASRPAIASATSALDAFVSVNAQIVKLSRRNTNVRSLALSLDEKRTLIAPCEDSLRALEAALAKRGLPARQ